MHVVPVIDIRSGVVVRAVAGRRAEYAPIITPLAPSSAPLDIVRALLTLHDFDALYIADLDAIEGGGENDATINIISDAFPNLRLWIDAGVRNRAGVEHCLSLRSADVVVGSESFIRSDDLRSLSENSRVILSLDFTGAQFLGDPTLLHDPLLWPMRVIVMTLSRIGVEQGPDMAQLSGIVSRAPGRRVYAAGGARDIGDLMRLRKAGAAGALVATALHRGSLTPANLAQLDGAGP